MFDRMYREVAEDGVVSKPRRGNSKAIARISPYFTANADISEAVGFIKKSATSGDWSVAIPWQGVQGRQGESFTVDAAGLFAERSDFDEAPAGFVYASTNGDGASITTSNLRHGGRRGLVAGYPVSGCEG